MSSALFANYLTRGYWGDEAWTAGISRLPISEIIRITGEDFHPPFYYFIVHFLGAGSGFSEVPVRLISVVFFLLIPCATFLLTRRLFPQKQSGFSELASILLILTSPILFTYAFEARSYALLALESVLSAYIFWRAQGEHKGQYLWRVLYFVLGAVMVYTHYYAWFILASHAVYLLLFDRKKILPLLPPALGILAAQAPWLPTLFGQTSSVSGSYWIGPINSQTHLEFLWRIGGGDIVSQWQKPLSYLILFLALFGLGSSFLKKSLKPPHLFLWTWLIIPTVIPTLISLAFFPVFFYRYLIFSSIPLLLLAVQGIKSLPLKVGYAVFAVILVGYLSVDLKIFRQHPRSMREAVRELYQTKAPGAAPVYTVLPAFAEVMYYAGPSDQVIVTPEGLVQFSGKSLLDAYVRLGYTTIEEPPASGYYFLTPDKQVELR